MKNKFKMNNGYRVWGIPACLAEAGRGYRGDTHPASRIPHPKFQFGFTLIELMAVVAIIMILASIMIPNIAKNVERGRIAKATADIDVLVKAVSLFQIDNGYIPEDLDVLLTSTGQGPYISSELEETPWGGTYIISSDSGSYTIETTDMKDNTPKVSKTITFGATE